MAQRGLGKGLDTLIPTGKVEVKPKKSTEKESEIKAEINTIAKCIDDLQHDL